MYIHQLPNWPTFEWDREHITNLLTDLRHQQGQLIGIMKSLGFSLQEETLLTALTDDAVKSSEIEGEILDQSLVRSSVARHLGIECAALDRVDCHIEGIVEMILDATQNFALPLTQKRLFEWHRGLFPIGRSGFSKIKVGNWRTGPVEVISGSMGRETIHFEGPPAQIVKKEMNRFLKWTKISQSIDFVLKAAIAHLWFVTIHPFDDGNGRISRTISDFFLARSEKTSLRCYSLSAQIQSERKDYYAILEETQKGDLNITSWLEWFLAVLNRAIHKAQSTLERVIHQAHFWESIADIPLNQRQRKVLNRLLVGFEGKLTSSKWAKMTKCSQDTAQRDIHALIQWEILIKNPGGGRSTSYRLKDSCGD